MRSRIALLVSAVFLSLLAPVPQIALAAGGFASAPVDVTTTAIAGGIRVTWTVPVDIDSGITGYRIESSTNGTSGSWNLATSVASNIRSHDILGLSQTALYIRVGATTAAGTGTYGYPWTKIYGTTSKNRDINGNIVYESGFGVGAGNASSTHSSAAFSRVRYRMDATISGAANYADTDFYKWVTGTASQATSITPDPTVNLLRIPTINSSFNIQANVNDLNIFSDSSAVMRTNGSTGINGRLEIWPWNYGAERVTTLSDGVTNGSDSTYDYNDTPATTGTYGSFQIHDMANYRPVFAWNNHLNTSVAELGFGRNTGNNPDWTFCSRGSTDGSCVSTDFRLQIFINIATTPLADATPPTVSRIDARTIIKNGDTITVRSNEIGTVYLVRNTVSVTNLASITSAASNVRNSVVISAANTNTVLTASGLLDGVYNLYAVDSANLVSTAILATVTSDSTAPTLSSLSVNASGSAILLTASETITNSLQVLGTYTISDSGSALTVTATSFIGNIATLTLLRAIPAGATVSFAYAPSGGLAAGRWSDLAGNELAAISTRTITNGSTVPITVSLTVPDNISKGISITITSIVSVAGRVTFTVAGKRIPGCLNRVANGTTPISVSCTFKPALTSRQIIGVRLTPSIGAYPVTLAAVERVITKRNSRR